MWKTFNSKIPRRVRIVWTLGVYLFAIIGFALVAMYVTVATGLTNSKGLIDKQQRFFQNQEAAVGSAATPLWAQGEEWETLEAGILRDKDVIKQVAAETNTDARLLVSLLIVEQLRLFHTERAIFKQVFAPLQILGNQSQFSWGVMGIKPETAIQTEENLKNPASPFYLGTEYEHILDFKAENIDEIGQERFERITNEDSRYWSYLYAALIAKQIQSQWQKAGFPIDNRPEIVATLYNIGFSRSYPKAEPLVGGADIEIIGTTYTFGGLAGEFYYSNELQSEFPSR